MPFWAYILRCSDHSYYTGHTDDLDYRVGQHQSGSLGGYTHDKRPVELMWAAEFSSRDEAFAMEMRIKKWSRVKKEALIAGQHRRLGYFAVPPSERGQRKGISASLDPVPRLRSGGAKSSVAPEPPAIVLVRPQLGENIGKAARAMLNFGLTDMRLVAPRDGWPNPDAGPAAAGADKVLEQASVFETVAQATADCSQVYATTVRRRGVTKPVITPERAALDIRSSPGRSAILFGPERSGLDTEDVALARTIITVPINPAFGSLNLAQAVILIAYEWSKGENLASPPSMALDPPAPQEELEAMISQLEAMLEKAHYFFPPDRAPVTRRTLRNILTRPGWNAGEVRTLRGILRALSVGNPRQQRDG